MRKTPSYLKGLAETRARAAGDLERALELLAEAKKAVDTARHDLAACDRLITRFDSRIDPGKIAPIHGRKGRYGPRGALKSAIERYLREQAPSDIGTLEVSLVVQHEFGLAFSSDEQRDAWVNDSVRRQLARLFAEGLVDRLHEPKAFQEGRWRWKRPAGSLAELREQALLAGVQVADSSAPKSDVAAD